MQKNLLVIGVTWPEPRSTAAGTRMVQLLEFFKGQGYMITFSSTASEVDRSYDFTILGIRKVVLQLNHSSFDTFLTLLKPDLVLFDRFLTEEQFGWRVAEFAPNALRILDTEDLHSLRKTREKAFRSQIDWTTEYWLQSDMCKRELASIFRSDVSLIISSYELQLLQEKVKMDSTLLLQLPFLVPPLSEELIAHWKSYDSRSDFVCIGNGKHAPNVDAILWLKKEIWPLIRKQLPKALLHIYGAYLPEQVLQLQHQKEGFLVHGWAAEIADVMGNARVNLAPLRFGAGLKGKLIAAMYHGTPSVTTPIGAEGLHGAMDFCGRIGNTAETFAVEAVALHQDQQLWQTAQDDGVAILNSLYNKKQLSKKLASKLRTVQHNLEGHRAQNIIGQMLMHQTMASTKYMSKWIAEKNKQ